jgi:murein DD-endopeptidase MepM/ murein hydrolase activator NlpD
LNGLALSLLLTLNVLFNPEAGFYFPSVSMFNDSRPDTVSVAKMAETLVPDSLNYDPDSMNPDDNTNITVTEGSLKNLIVLENFKLPTNGKVISHFGVRRGRMHTGTDIKLHPGDTVVATYKGIVVRASSYYGYGKLVVVDHQNGLETYYGHLSKILVKNGDIIRSAQPVGLGGRTGRATTDHLHFEIRENRKPCNSELVFDYENGRVKPEVNGYKSLASMSSGSSARKSSSGQKVLQHLPVPAEYAIRTGDSLWKIARRFGTTVSTLCQLNQLTPTSVLNIGRIIKITAPTTVN